MLGTAIVGAVVAIFVGETEAWLSEDEPVQVSLAPAVEEPPAGYLMVVPDASGLPDVSEFTDCSELWRTGLAHGGVPVSTRIQPLVLTGQAKDGIVVTGMRAIVTSRGPADGDAELSCPSAGAVEPEGFSFELVDYADEGTPIDRAEALRYPVGEEQEADEVDQPPQFGDGFVLAMKENEPVPLVFSTDLPADRITWFYEVDLLVGGQRRTTRIDDHGTDFSSPGYRSDSNSYRVGKMAGVANAAWGVDPRLERVDPPGGTPALRYRDLLFPVVDGLDAYQPLDGQEQELSTGYRTIRRDGRPIVRFNPPGVAPEHLARGKRCEAPAGADHGVVSSITTLTAERTVRAGQLLDVSIAEVRCSAIDDLAREGPDDADAYYRCSRPRCPQVVSRIARASFRATGTQLTADVTDPNSPDAVLARRLLDEVVLDPAVPTTTAEPIAALPAEHAVGSLAGATDIGFIVDLFQDDAGEAIVFDKADVVDGSVVNTNDRLRVLRLTEQVDIQSPESTRGSFYDLSIWARTERPVALLRDASGTVHALAPAS